MLYPEIELLVLTSPDSWVSSFNFVALFRGVLPV